MVFPDLARLRHIGGTASFAAAAAACAVAVSCSTGPSSDVNSVAVPADGGVAPLPKGTPTWYGDVEPIVQSSCAFCHAAGNTGAFELDRATTVSLASLAAERVAARIMPPWPPRSNASDTTPLVGSLALSDAAIATIVAWAEAGAPLGDEKEHVARPFAPPVLPAGPPDLELARPDSEAYVSPANPFVLDDARCFVLDVPDGAADALVTEVRWRADKPQGVHDMGGIVVDAASATLPRARMGSDGRPGFECGGGLGDVTGVPLGASSAGNPSRARRSSPRRRPCACRRVAR